jgi:hypothetical protein
MTTEPNFMGMLSLLDGVTFLPIVALGSFGLIIILYTSLQFHAGQLFFLSLAETRTLSE